MQKFLAQTLTEMPTLFQSFSTTECNEFLVILNKSLADDIRILSAKEQRQKRRALIAQLDDKVEDADFVADTLVDMGIYDDIEDIMPLLIKNNSRNTIELAYKLSELKRGTQTINTATERAAKIVFALKSYAHQDDSGKRQYTNVITDIETVLTLYHGQMKHSIELVKNYQNNLPNLYCYPDELNQVWTNLIHNSLQATGNEGIITVTVAQQEKLLKVSIQDSGKGIEPENRIKIFDAFYTTKPIGEGSGLGLHIIKKIIDKHSGTIDVESQPGCTVFTVSLPIEQPIKEEQK